MSPNRMAAVPEGCRYPEKRQQVITDSATLEWVPPRPYLTEAVDRTIAAADAGKRGVVHLPTGTGKTVKAARVIQHYHRKHKRSLFLHHRRELGSQSLGKFQ